MTRLSEYLLPTEKQARPDAEAISHKLMVRAGLVRQMGAGMWSWLPAGWRVHQRVVAIIRTKSRESIRSRFPSGVPSTGTSALIGTLSGCGSKLASTCSMPARIITRTPF